MTDLTHIGVKGMKWGHRKQRAVVGRKSSTAKPKSAKNVAAAVAKNGPKAKALISKATKMKISSTTKEGLKAGAVFVAAFAVTYGAFKVGELAPGAISAILLARP